MINNQGHATMMMRTMAKIIACFLYFALCSVHGHQYPRTRRDPSVVDDYFGHKVADPYRWLEDPKSNETKVFIEQQNNLTQHFVRSNPHWARVRQSFQDLLNYGSHGIPEKHGDKYYVVSQGGHDDQPIVYTLTSLEDKNPKVFLDPNKLSDDHTASLTGMVFSPDGKYCAYGISSTGTDWVKIKIRDTATKKDLAEELVKIKFSFASWSPNSRGLFYACYDEFNGTVDGTDPRAHFKPKLFYHSLNTSQSADILLEDFPNNPQYALLPPIVIGNHIHIFPAEGAVNMSWGYAEFDPENITGRLKFNWIVKKTDARYTMVSIDESCIYIVTNKDAEYTRLVCVDMKKPEAKHWKDVLPSRNGSVLSNVLVMSGGHLVAVYMINNTDVIEVIDRHTGKLISQIKTGGQIVLLQPSATGFYYKVTNFTTPGVIYEHNLNTTTTNIFRDMSAKSVKTEDYVVKQIDYPSKDGTLVNMFLFHRKDLRKNGKNPTLLFAYGGFDILTGPGYDALGMFFAKHFNGIFALANIRGGGERGKRWHLQGSRQNKHNSFDDFAAAAEWLTKNKYTSRDYLTIYGVSNSGLLAGAVSNMRPDLFGASVVGVGVHDMLRYRLHTLGYSFTEEFGNPNDNEQDFETIRRYSPYHNVPTNVTGGHYPHMLTTTSTHDDRVVPSHTYKFISQLQHNLGDKLPQTAFMVRIDSKVGHWLGKPLWKRLDENTDIICFLLNTLKYSYHP